MKKNASSPSEDEVPSTENVDSSSKEGLDRSQDSHYTQAGQRPKLTEGRTIAGQILQREASDTLVSRSCTDAAGHSAGLCRGVVSCSSQSGPRVTIWGRGQAGKGTNRSLRIIIDGDQAHSALV